MSKRNRRRTRGGRRSVSLQADNADIPWLGEPPLDLSPLPRPMGPVQGRRNDLAARHWHNRFLAWQARDRRQREEAEKLKRDQRRIFGGDSQDGGEDSDRLCSNMIAFFDSLDYLKEDYGFC